MVCFFIFATQVGANYLLVKIYLELLVNYSLKHTEVKISKYTDEMNIDLSLSVNVNSLQNL